MAMLWLSTAACMPRPSGACEATAGAQLRNERGELLDLDDPMAVQAATGRPVLWCAALRLEVSGRVVNARSGAGIEGAQLVVESWRARPPVVGDQWVLLDLAVTRTFTTNGDGEFDVSAEAAWMPGILAADGFPSIVQRTTVAAPGYETRVFEPALGSTGPPIPERIALQASGQVAHGATSAHVLRPRPR